MTFTNIMLEEKMHYSLMTLLVIVVFYGIYFSKILVQKHNGIRTNQIGSRKEKGIHTVETLMRTATFSIVPVQLLSCVWMELSSGGGSFYRILSRNVRRYDISVFCYMYEKQLAGGDA